MLCQGERGGMFHTDSECCSRDVSGIKIGNQEITNDLMRIFRSGSRGGHTMEEVEQEVLVQN